jgi:excisionase family DNA binding protein
MINEVKTPRAEQEDALSKREVADRFRVTIRTIDSWMSTRKMPYYKIGKSCYFKWLAVQKWADTYSVN